MSTEVDATTAVQEGLAALREGDAVAALAILERALLGGARSAELLYYRAVALVGLGRLAEALSGARTSLAERVGYAPALELIDRLEGLLGATTKTLSPALADTTPGVVAWPGEDWQTGQVIEGRWEVFGSAQGGMGKVYFVHDREWDSVPLALKTLLVSPELRPEQMERAKERFLRETTVWLDLGAHPHIVSGFYTLEIAGVPRFFMEYVPGLPLDTVLSRAAGPLPLAWALDLLIQLAAGMEYVHARNVVHRDLKPQNCLIMEDGALRVTDFGLSKEMSRGERGEGELLSTLPLWRAPVPGVSTRLSKQGAGTPDYMPPEQWEELRRAERPADVYAFGVLLYELLAGRRPFGFDLATRRRYVGRAPTEVQRILDAEHLTPELKDQVVELFHRYVTPLSLSELGVVVPPALEALALLCLEKDPARRPSFGEIRGRLLALYEEGAGVAYPRELPGALLPSEAGENNRAISYYTMGQVEKAKAILDAWLAREPTALYPWLNRRTLALNEGEVEEAAVEGELRAVIRPVHAKALEGDPSVAAFQKRLGRYVFSHKGPVIGAAFLPDNRRLVTASEDRASLWDIESGALLRSFEGHGGEITALALSPDGRLLLTAGQDRTARLWEIEKGALARMFLVGDAQIRTAALSYDGRFIFFGGSRVQLWETTRGKLVRALEGASAVALSADGHFAATGGQSVRLWEIPRDDHPRLLRALKGHAAPVTALAFSPDGRLLASGSEDKTVRLWARAAVSGQWSGVSGEETGEEAPGATAPKEARSNKPPRTSEEHPEAITALAFSPDGKLLAIGSGDKTVKLWARTVASGEKPREVRPSRPERGLSRGGFSSVPQQPPREAESSDRGRGAGGSPLTLEHWPLTTILRHEGGVTVVSFSPDGRLLLTGSKDGKVRLYETAPAPWPLHIRRDLSVRERLSRAREREELLRRLSALDTSAYAPLQTLRAQTPEYQRDAALLEALHRLGLYWGRREGIRDAFCAQTFVVGARVNVVGFSPDGGLAFTGDGEGSLRLWALHEAGRALPRGEPLRRVDEAEHNEPAKAVIGHKGPITAALFLPGGQLLATGGQDKTVKLWALQAGGGAEGREGGGREGGRAEGREGGGKASEGREGGGKRAEGSEGTAVSSRLTPADSPSPSEVFLPQGEAPWKPPKRAMWWADSSPGPRADASAPSGVLLPPSRPPVDSSPGPPPSFTLVQVLKGHSFAVTSLSSDAAGERLLTGSGEKTARLWTLAGFRGAEEAAVSSPSLASLASPSDAAASSGVLLPSSRPSALPPSSEPPAPSLELEECEEVIGPVALLSGGRVLCTGCSDGTVRLWDARSGAPAGVLRGHKGPVRTLAASPDGRLLVAGSGDAVRLWSTGPRRLLATLEGHSDRVLSVAFSPDGRLVLSGSKDKTVRLWAVRRRSDAPPRAADLRGGETGPCVRVFEGHRGAVRSVAFSPDGRLVLSGSEDGTARLWILDWDWAFLEELLGEAEARLEAFVNAQPPGGAAGEVDDWLDLWSDLGLSRARPPGEPALARRLDAVRRELLRVLGELVKGASPALPESAKELLAHPLYRAGLVDPALAEALSREPGGLPR